MTTAMKKKVDVSFVRNRGRDTASSSKEPTVRTSACCYKVECLRATREFFLCRQDCLKHTEGAAVY